MPPLRFHLPVILLFSAAAFLWPSLRANDQDRLNVGLQPDGRVVVPTNQILQPAGQQVTFPGRPVDLALAEDGKVLVVKNMKDLVFIDVATAKVKQTLPSPIGFSVVGLLVQGERIFASDVRDHVRIAVRDEKGKYTWAEPIELMKPRVGSPPNPAGGPPNPNANFAHAAGIAARGASELWVTSTRGNSVQILNRESGIAEQRVPVGVAPYAVCFPREGKCYVSNWGGDPPKEGEPAVGSSGTPVAVDPRGIAHRGTVSVLEAKPGKWQQVKTIRVGLHPSGMIASHDGHFVYVANANSDTVSVINTESDEVAETIPCRPEARLPFGSGCNALALSPRGDLLYVANGTNNCVAVVALGSKSFRTPKDLPQESRLLGMIPTGWYPGGLCLSADGKTLFVANVKGLGSLSRKRLDDKEPRPEAKGRNSHDHLGSVSIIDLSDEAKLAEWTKQVNANNRLAYSLAGLEKPRADVAPVPVPQRHGEPSVIKHVIYVIKENRTYDQVFGDMKEGNGDANLCIFGEEVTPNHHKLAREFTLFDNFYCSGVLSADGHQWVNEAYVTDYLEKAFGGFARSYPYEGTDPLAFASSGFLWDNALERKRTFRNYGEFVKESAPKGATWKDMYEEYKTSPGKFSVEAKVTVQSLAPHTHPAYPGFVMKIPDVYRAKVFLEDLKAYEKKGEFPQLTYLYLPCDHTEGTVPGMPTPRAMVADNDLALGKVVEGVSKSKFWKETAIFVVEDDPQNGFDHVDGHRTVALVVSPYTRRKHVDSTNYNQTGMVKTIELILGLPPMNQLDLSATPMTACFQAKPDLTPYEAAKNRIELDEMNAPLKSLKGQALHWAKKSLELDFDDADDADEDTLNRILWYSVRGDAPYPAEFVNASDD